MLLSIIQISYLKIIYVTSHVPCIHISRAVLDRFHSFQSRMMRKPLLLSSTDSSTQSDSTALGKEGKRLSFLLWIYIRSMRHQMRTKCSFKIKLSNIIDIVIPIPKVSLNRLILILCEDFGDINIIIFIKKVICFSMSF